MIAFKLATVVLVAALAGCAASVQRAPAAGAEQVSVPAASSKRIALVMTGSPESTKSKDWELFKTEWRVAFKAASEARGVAFSMPEDGRRPEAAPWTLLTVHVLDYRYLSPGARYGLGIMTGNAFIDARVSFSDLASGKSFGQQSLNTSSSAWQGIFSAMTEKQVAAIAADLVGEVAKGR